MTWFLNAFARARPGRDPGLGEFNVGLDPKT